MIAFAILYLVCNKLAEALLSPFYRSICKEQVDLEQQDKTSKKCAQFLFKAVFFICI